MFKDGHFVSTVQVIWSDYLKIQVLYLGRVQNSQAKWFKGTVSRYF